MTTPQRAHAETGEAKKRHRSHSRKKGRHPRRYTVRLLCPVIKNENNRRVQTVPSLQNSGDKNKAGDKNNFCCISLVLRSQIYTVEVQRWASGAFPVFSSKLRNVLCLLGKRCQVVDGHHCLRHRSREIRRWYKKAKRGETIRASGREGH